MEGVTASKPMCLQMKLGPCKQCLNDYKQLQSRLQAEVMLNFFLI